MNQPPSASSTQEKKWSLATLAAEKAQPGRPHSTTLFPDRHVPVRPARNPLASPLSAVLLSLLLPNATAEEPDSISLNDLGYVAKRWTVSDGLPMERVVSITQTKDGHLWVGTRYSALARFDGTQFTAFSPSDIRGPGNYRLSGIYTTHGDRMGRLWFVIGGNRLGVRENGRFRLFGPEDGLEVPPGEIREITEGDDGEIWVKAQIANSAERALYRYHNNRFERAGSIAGSSSMAGTPEGTIWAMTENRPWCLTDNSLDAAPPDLSGSSDSRPFPHLTHLYDGKLAIASSEGIFTLEQDHWSLTYPYKAPRPRSLAAINPQQSPDGYFWLKSSRSGLVVRLHDGSLRQVTLPSLAMPSAVETIFCDREGSVWFGSGAGLYQLAPAPFTTWQMDPATPGTQVHTIGEDGEGRMWFAARGGIYHLPPGGNRVRRVDAEPRFDDWFVAGTPFGGAMVWPRSAIPKLWRPNTVVNQPQLQPERGRMVSFFLSQTTGNLWANDRKGLYRVTGKGTMTLEKVYEARREEIPFLFESFTEDSKGRLYMASHRHGLLRFDPDSGLDLLASPDRPSWSGIGPVAAPDDHIWCMTRSSPKVAPSSQGIGYWDGDKWHSAPWSELSVDLAPRAVKGIMTDLHDGLWVMTDRHGIFRLSREALQTRLRSGTGQIPVEWFGLDDGLASEAGSFHLLGVHRDRKGRIWFATNAGASIIDPERWFAARERLPAPPVVMKRVMIDNTESNLDNTPTEPVVVKPSQSRVEFGYAALHFASPAKVNYRYQLEGYDEGWIDAGNRREASYQRIPPGDYVFRVIASNGHGKWNETGATVALVVEPFWWQRTSVRLLAAGLLIAAIWFFVWIRMRYLHRNHARQEAFSRSLINTQESERQRIALELHDGLGQGLLLIKNAANLTLRRHAHEERVERRLREMSELATNAVKEVRSITAELRPPELDAAGLTAALEAMIEKVARHTELTVESHLDQVDGLWSPEQSIHFYRIVQECFNNALKHSQATRIEVRVRRHEENVTVLIEDNGAGFIPQTENSPLGDGSGLKGVRERVKYLSGEMNIDSAPGAGTHLYFRIPITHAPPHPHSPR